MLHPIALSPAADARRAPRVAIRPLIALGLAAVLGCAREPAAESAGAPAAADPPGVVIVLIDTLRADFVAPFGGASGSTPAIEALARESVVFEQASSAAPWTLPSVVSLFTSTFVAEHEVERDGKRLSPDVPTLTDGLRTLGYRTLSLLRNPYAGELSGLDRSFERCDFVQREVDGRRVRPWLATLKGKPFFLYVHDTQPHDPQKLPPQLAEAVSKESREEIGDAADLYRKLTRADFARHQPLGTIENTQEQSAALARLDARREDYRVLYAAAVREADRCIGEIVGELRRAGRWENTLFFLVADHGEEMGDHGGWQHDQSLYEELVHVPLLVHLPGGAHGGTRVATPVSLVDVLPTVAAVLEKPEIARGARGKSLLPLMQGERDAAPRVTAVRWNEKKFYRPWAERRGERNVAMRQGKFKAIWNADLDALELYDLEADPREQRDLSAEQPELAQRFAELGRHAWDEQEQARRGRSAGGTAEMKEEQRKALEQLGYVGNDDGG